MPTTSEVLLKFFSLSEVREKHNDPALLDRYTPDMEVQINVAPDGGEPVEGKRNTWCNPDSPTEQWHHIRMPKDAMGDPVRNDWELKFSLHQHAEGIGCTGWDFDSKRSRWFGFDFDSIVGHAEGVGISDEDLEAVKAAAWKIPWLEIRTSTGGGGFHMYAMCSDEGIPTTNHTEHAALGRAVLELMANTAKFKFTEKVDVCGGNMWIWHRRSSPENEGLKLLKPATAFLTTADIPGDWRSHLDVVKGKRATQRIVGVPEDADVEFDNLVRSRKQVPLSDEHNRVIDALADRGFSVIYQQDNHLVQTHTAGLAQLAEDPALGIAGIFKTSSKGNEPGQPNAFMFPQSNGGWKVYRFGPGTSETATWDQKGYWTCCYFNVRYSLAAAIQAVGGYEQSDGTFVTDTTTQGLEVLKAIGVDTNAPDWAHPREMRLKRHKSPRKVIAFIEYANDDENPRSRQDMRDHGWNLEGQRADTKKWSQVFDRPSSDNDEIAAEQVDRCDEVIRSLKTPDAEDAGWRLMDADGVWVGRDRTSAMDMLCNLGIPNTEQRGVIARLQYMNWTMVNLPFQPEFPGGRVWNIGAQLAFEPTTDDRDMLHPHWDMILDHLGRSVDEAVKYDPWCQKYGITTGSRYLLYWAASLFQRPDQKLPYLFFYGPQETGKSALHNALGLLMSRGHVEARNSLLTTHNAELDGAILAFVEEVDLSRNADDVYNRVKDLITSDNIMINPKYVNPYKVVSYLHWIQVANHRDHCPVFEDDTRIVVINVAEKPQTDIPWPELKSRLQAEAPDFLRTLFDLCLPDEGIGRLWLPVLDTEAKQASIANRLNEDDARSLFDPHSLWLALENHLLGDCAGRYEDLVSHLMEELGDGPWAKDHGTFGRQLRIVFKEAANAGVLKYDFKTTNEGQVVKYAFDANPNKMDAGAEILALHTEIPVPDTHEPA